MQSNSTSSTFTGKPTSSANGRQPGVKPSKPHPEYPLYAHASKRWAKKIRGRTHFFGPWDDPDGALTKYLDQKDALHSGRTPRPDAAAVIVKDIANAFLVHKQSQVDAGELSPRTWRDCKYTCDLLVSELGKRRLVADIGPADFAKLRRAMAERWGLHGLAKHIQGVRSMFKFAVESQMIERPVQFGPAFKRPSKKNFRVEKASHEIKLFTAEEIHRMIDAASVPLRAMFLLAVNAGYGNADCGQLVMRAVDLDAGMIVFPRPKTGLNRRCPLWPETTDAIKTWLAVRPAPKGDTDADLVFVTAQGNSWFKEMSDNPISKETAKLFKKIQINGSRNFYTLRHTHRTISDEVCDQRASGFIMGHVDPSMASHYVETVSDERLRRITDHIHDWLYGKPTPAPKRTKKEAAEPDAGAVQAAAEWQKLYEGAIPDRLEYAEIDRRNRAILEPLTRVQLHAVAKLIGFSCRASDSKAALIDGIGRRIAERVGSQQRNQFRAAEGGAK